VVERSTFYRIIIITNTIKGKEVTKLLGILQYNFAMESINLKYNTHTCQEIDNVLGILEKNNCPYIYLQYALKKAFY
jgi:ligand-binding sensor protein